MEEIRTYLKALLDDEAQSEDEVKDDSEAEFEARQSKYTRHVNEAATKAEHKSRKA